MNAQAIMEQLEGRLLRDWAYHLAVPTGRLELYHCASTMRDRDVIDRPYLWDDMVSGLYGVIIGMQPFCMRAPDELMQFAGADVAQGDLLRVVRMHNIIRSAMDITVNFYGRVFNAPA